MTTVIMKTTARIVVPIIVVVSISLFLQGHNLPGGGFIAGVLTTTAFVLLYIAYNIEFLEEGVLGRENQEADRPFRYRVVSAYRRTFALGLLIAVGSGLTPLVLDYPFLDQAYTIFEHVPIYHEIELPSAVIFDLGVYCVVVGGILTILSVVSSK